MEAIVLLADWAEAINGKLYIQGGGWTRYTGQTPPGAPSPILNCALAIRFLVGWDEANKKHDVVIRLVDGDGHPVAPIPGGPSIEIRTQLEVGRPAGSTEGADLDAVTAVQFHGLPLPSGRYAFILEINGTPTTARTVFDVA